MNFPLPIKAVVIDLDGTLLNTAPDLAHAAELMMADLGRPCPSLETISTYIGNGVSRLVKRVLTGEMDAEPDAALFARAMPLYQKHYGEHVSLHSRPFDGVVEGLDAFKAMGLHIACITNKAEQFTVPLLKDTGLFDYFELILSGDTLPKRKPDPLPLLHACEVFKVAAGRVAADRRFAQRHPGRARRRLPGVLRALRLQPRSPGRRTGSGCGGAEPGRGRQDGAQRHEPQRRGNWTEIC